MTVYGNLIIANTSCGSNILHMVSWLLQPCVSFKVHGLSSKFGVFKKECSIEKSLCMQLSATAMHIGVGHVSKSRIQKSNYSFSSFSQNQLPKTWLCCVALPSRTPKIQMCGYVSKLWIFFIRFGRRTLTKPSKRPVISKGRRQHGVENNRHTSPAERLADA